MGWCTLRGTKKSRIVMLVAACAMIGTAIVCRQLTGQTPPAHVPGATQLQEHAAQQPESGDDSQQTEQILGEEALLTALEEALDGKLRLSEASAEIGEDAVVALSGAVRRDEVEALLQERSDGISSAYRSVLRLLPDSLPVYLELALYAEDGALCALPRSLRVASLELPDDAAGAEWFDLLNRSLNRQLAGEFSRIESVTSAGGKLTLSGVRA